MSLLDLLVALIVVSAAFGGYRAGFVSRAAGWAGLLAGLTLAVLLIPLVVDLFDAFDDAWVLLAALAVLVASAAAGQVVGLQLGDRAQQSLPSRIGPADRFAGAIAGGAGVMVLFWLFLPTLAAVPGWTAQQVDDSLAARLVESALPEPPDALEALRNTVGESSFPTVFDASSGLVDPGPAPTFLSLDAAVIERASASIVRIQVAACGRGQQGTGYVHSTDLIVTNAHVVAGASQVTAFDEAGVAHSGTVVGFDAARDLAAIRIPGLGLEPLPWTTPLAGTDAATFGHPGGASLRVAPTVVADVLRARGRDLYDASETMREVLVLAVSLRLGDSGAPVVNTDGFVVGVAFAVAPDGDETAYAVTTAEVEMFLSEHDLTLPAPPSACL